MITQEIHRLAQMLWNYLHLRQTAKKADAIMALGSHDTQVSKKASELYFQNFAPYVIFSGGFGRLTDKAWTRPEAVIFREIAENLGVPTDAIIAEQTSTNTEENLRFSMDILKKRMISPKNILLVHSPYMERRAMALWKKVFPEIQATITSPNIAFDDYPLDKEEIIHNLVGETLRMKHYPEKGFIIKEEIPKDVWDACEKLQRAGFTKYLIA